jgi:ribosomal protein L7/L12
MLEAMLMLAIGAVVGVVIGAVVMSLSRGSSDVEPLVPQHEEPPPLRVRRRPAAPPPPPAVAPEDLDDQLLGPLREGNNIAAIKLARELTGWSLREAKAYVDALAQRNLIRH